MGAILKQGPYQAKWMQNDYETYVREGYLGNPYVFAAIRQISMAFAGIPWNVYKDESKKTKYDTHPYLTLLRHPNPRMGGSRFWETFIGYLMLDGNEYIERVPRSGPPQELWPLRPDRMRVVPGNLTNSVAGYVYRIGSDEVAFPAEVILHYKTFHPANDWYGVSPIMAMSKSVDQSNQAKQWNVSLLQNGATPTGALMSPRPVDDDQYRRLREMIEERYSGFMNAGRPIIVEGGITWEQMGMSPTDMAWLEGQKLSAREIAMGFNIAPELIGDPESKTFSNYGEARVALMEENVLPLADWVRDDLNGWLGPLFDGAYADYDRDGIEALRENQDAVYTRNNAAFVAGWINIGDAQKAAGMDVDKEVAQYYKWQLPQSASFDPTQEQPTPATPAAGSLPYPDLPPTHVLNQGPPSLLSPDEKEPNPNTPSNPNNPDKTGSLGGVEPMGPAQNGKQAWLPFEAVKAVRS